MQEKEFEIQVGRLTSQWRNDYGTERRALLWAAFKDAMGEDFRSAVDYCLASHRRAPLLDDLSKEIDQAKVRRQQSRGGSSSFYGQLVDAAELNRKADPEFVKACLKHVSDFLGARMSREQFDQGCDLLDSVAKQLHPETRPGFYASHTLPKVEANRTGDT